MNQNKILCKLKWSVKIRADDHDMESEGKEVSLIHGPVLRL